MCFLGPFLVGRALASPPRVLNTSVEEKQVSCFFNYGWWICRYTEFEQAFLSPFQHISLPPSPPLLPSQPCRLRPSALTG